MNVSTAALKKAVALTDKAAEYKSSSESMRNAEVSLYKHGITLESAGPRVGVHVLLPTPQQKGSGLAIVNARMLKALVAKLKNKSISLETTDTQLHISAGKRQLALRTNAYEPIKHGVPEGAEATMLSEEFSEQVNGVIYAVSKDKARPHLAGIKLEQVDGRLRMVATDGHRLALTESSDDIALDSDFPDSIIHLDALKVLQAALKATKAATVHICIGSEKASFKMLSPEMEVTVKTRLVSSKFPPYDKVIPKASDTNTVAVVCKAELLEAAQLAKSLADSICLNLNGDFVMSSTDTTLDQTFEEKIEAGVNGPALEIHFDPRYLFEAVQSLRGPRLILAFNERLDPVKISESESTSIAVIMPKRA